MNKWIRSFILLLFALSTQWVQAQNVAKVGTTEYATLQAAFDAAQAGATVTLLDDVDATGAMYSGDIRFNLWVKNSITIDGGGHTLTVKGRGIGVQGVSSDIDVTFSNITITNHGNVNGRCIDTRGKIGSLTLNNAKLTTAESSYTGYLQPLTIGGNQASTATVNITNSQIIVVENANKGYAITTFNPVKMTVNGSTIKGWACFNIKGPDNSAGSKGSTITVANSTLVSANGTPGTTNSFSLVKIEDDNVSVNITGSTINVNGGDNMQSIVSFQKKDLSNSANCEVALGEGNNVTLEGEHKFASNVGETSALNITGGTFNVEVPEEYMPEGYGCHDNGNGTYTVKQLPSVAQIGTKGYPTLQAAVDAAEDGAIIELLKDFELTTVTTTPNSKYNVNVNKSVTIDGKGFTITSSQGKRALVLTGEGNDITLKNLTVVNNKADWVMGITSNLTCTLDNTTIDGSNFSGGYNQPITVGSISGNGRVTLNVTNGSIVKTNDEGTAHYSIILWHPADVTVTDSKLIGWANIYIKPDAEGSTVTIDGSEMVSKGINGDSNNFAVIVAECGNNSITITDTKITTTPAADTYQSLVSLSGTGNVVKFLGSTTYATSDMTYGAATFNWNRLKENTLYFDDTSKAVFEQYFDGSNNFVISDTKDATEQLYPVVYAPEVFYYWATENGYQGGYYQFVAPFENGWLDNGEFIALQKDIELTKNIVCQLTDGQSFNFLLGDFVVTKGDYSVSINTGVTVNTDKQTDIFSASEEGYKVVEEATETGYVYSVVPKTYVAQIGNVKFESLQAALDAANNGETILLLADIDMGNQVVHIDKAVTINGDGHTITSTASAAVEVSGTGDVTISNTKINATAGRGIQVGNLAHYSGNLTINEGTVITVGKRGINILDVDAGFQLNVDGSIIQSNVADPTTTYTTGDDSRGINFSNDPLEFTANITNSEIRGFSYCTNIYSGTQNLTLNITGGKTYGRDIVNNWGKNNTFNLDGVEVHGLNNQTGPTEAFSCIVDNTGSANNNYNINDCQFIATLSDAAINTANSSASEYLIDLRGNNAKAVITGTTSYTTNATEKGGFIQYEPYIDNNTIMMDQTAAATFADAFNDYKIVTTEEEPGYIVVKKDYVAQIGTDMYETLQDAIDAAEDGAIIELLKDFELTTVTTTPNSKYNVNVNKHVTIDGKGFTITSSQGKRALVLTGEGNDITLKNLTVVNNKADWVMGITDNLTCTLDNTTIDGSNYSGGYNQPITVGSISGNGRVTLNVTNGSIVKTNDEGTAHYSIILWHPADVTVTDSKLIGWANIYIKPDAEGSTVTIDGSEMVSKGISGNSNNFAVIVTECGNNTITVTDTKITSTPAADTYQSLVSLSGTGNVVKFLGSTTYTTSDMNYGAATTNWPSLKDNKLYFDDTTKAAFEQYFDGSNNAVIDDETDETNLYPVNFSPEILYYWATNNGYQGGYYDFVQPFEEGWLDDGEFIALQKDVTLTKDIVCQLTDGQSFNFLLGDFAVTKGDYSVSLNLGVTVNTDKQTDIFSAAEPGYIVLETVTADGYNYSLVNVPASSLIVFHDSGTYEQAFEVPIYSRMASADIYYKVNGGAAQKYSAPVSISADTELEAWLQVGNTKVGESVVKNYAIVAREAGPSVADNYYYIKNNGNSKYVNVAGRKTVTFMDKTAAEKAPGAVIRVKAAEGGAVETLRSQAIDLPGYAKRAMNYVPEMVQLIVSKLHADGTGNILGEDGLDAIMNKFNESFDYNLYLEEYNGGYRIYGRTPSMKPVVDFYAENKEQVDAKLPQLETFINSAIDKLKAKLNGRGESILKPFSVEAVWEAMGGTLTKPEDAESTSRFYEEVLASEVNVWSFAYETAMMYYKPLMDSETFQGAIGQFGDYSKYLDKLPNVRPNFKYYIVADGSKVDFISEGNPDSNTAKAEWTLEDRSNFTIAFDENDKLVDGLGTKYYTTLYTDFAFTMPENAKAYAVTSYNTKGVADLEELTGVIPAQTPVLLMTQDESLAATLTLSTEAGTAPSTNLLKGADWIVNEYDLQTAQLHDLFELVKEKLGENFYNNYLAKYEHLLALNAGTVNNKYFFGLKAEYVEEVTNIRQLGVDENELGEMKLGFYENFNALPANKAFLIEEPNPVLIPLWPDITCDGLINVADVTALVAIILDDDMNGPDWIYPYYNHNVADVNQDGIIGIADVTTLVSIIFEIENETGN